MKVSNTEQRIALAGALRAMGVTLKDGLAIVEAQRRGDKSALAKLDRLLALYETRVERLRSEKLSFRGSKAFAELKVALSKLPTGSPAANFKSHAKDGYAFKQWEARLANNKPLSIVEAVSLYTNSRHYSGKAMGQFEVVKEFATQNSDLCRGARKLAADLGIAVG